VDNASTDSTASIIQSFRSKARLRPVFCAEPGLSHARNAGARAARSPVLIFIDDDAMAGPDLVAAYLDLFDSHPLAGAAGGRIRLELPSTLPRWYGAEFDGYYSAFDLGFSSVTRVHEIWQYPFGANCAYRRQVLAEVGGFSTRLGRVGKDQAGGEEIDATIRVAARGGEVYFTPRAEVLHVIAPERLHAGHITRSARAAGRNWAYYEVELLGQRPAPWLELAPLAATLWQMTGAARGRSRHDRLLAYSKHLFYRSKFLRKLRYWATAA
jgi:GT2 family glycosyltransferase